MKRPSGKVMRLRRRSSAPLAQHLASTTSPICCCLAHLGGVDVHDLCHATMRTRTLHSKSPLLGKTQSGKPSVLNVPGGQGRTLRKMKASEPCTTLTTRTSVNDRQDTRGSGESKPTHEVFRTLDWPGYDTYEDQLLATVLAAIGVPSRAPPRSSHACMRTHHAPYERGEGPPRPPHPTHLQAHRPPSL